MRCVVVLVAVFAGFTFTGSARTIPDPTNASTRPVRDDESARATGSRTTSPASSTACISDGRLSSIRKTVDFAEQRLKWGLFAGVGRVLPDAYFHPRFLGIAPPLVGPEAQRTGQGQCMQTDSSKRAPHTRLDKSVLIRSALPDLLLATLGEWKAPSENSILEETLIGRRACETYLSQPTVQVHAMNMDFSGMLGEYRVSLSGVNRLVDFVGRTYKYPRTRTAGGSYMEFVFATYLEELDEVKDEVHYPVGEFQSSDGTPPPETPVGSPSSSDARRVGATAEDSEDIHVPKLSIAPEGYYLSPTEKSRVWCNKVKIHRQAVWTYFDSITESIRDLERVVAQSPPEAQCSLYSPQLYMFTGDMQDDLPSRIGHELGYSVQYVDIVDHAVSAQALEEDTCHVLTAVLHNPNILSYVAGYWRPSWYSFLDGLRKGLPEVELSICAQFFRGKPGAIPLTTARPPVSMAFSRSTTRQGSNNRGTTGSSDRVITGSSGRGNTGGARDPAVRALSFGCVKVTATRNSEATGS